MTLVARAGQRRSLGQLIACTRGIGAVEFAIVAPFLILIYIGSYQLMDAISAYRKVTTTAKTLADLTAQDQMMTFSDAGTIVTGASQVMAPYSTANATLSIAEIKIDNDGKAHLTWTWPQNANVSLQDIKMPAAITIANTSVIYSQIIYQYEPVVGGSLIGPITFSDHIFMNPRNSPSVCLNSGTVQAPVCVGEGPK